MLLELRIQNLVLVESATVQFTSGLNVITGETGSGKSAVMAALGLIAGERADLSMIRHGTDRGCVEAVFAITPAQELTHLLEEAGIDATCDEPIIIRREIAPNGKGRAFINQQPVHVSFLRPLNPFLFDLVGQHANHMLFSTESHRKIVDLYGDLTPQVRSFGHSWHEETLLRQELDDLVAQEAQRLRDIDRFQTELEEIEEVNVKEGEDEEIFTEYTRLSNAEELAMKVETLHGDLTGDDKPVIPTLNRHLKILEELINLDPSFSDIAASYKNTVVELEEAGYAIQHYMNHIENDPERAAALNERLTAITKLKRKYGATVVEIKEYESNLKKQLNVLQNAHNRIDELKPTIEAISAENAAKAQAITEERRRASSKLSKALTQQLQSLNMPHVEVSILLEPQKRSQYGDDKVEFYMRPNKGERSIAVRECASGGELSRLLLSIQTLLAGKQATPCLIFDEVDANIGGETATVVGEKLREMAIQHQVLCITHFPQVATQCDHHLQIAKVEMDGRTLTTIQTVDGAARKKELQRMRG